MQFCCRKRKESIDLSAPSLKSLIRTTTIISPSRRKRWLIWMLQQFEVYLGSGDGHVMVFTDHNPWTFLNLLQCPNQRLMQWALFLRAHALDRTVLFMTPSAFLFCLLSSLLNASFFRFVVAEVGQG